VEPYRAVRKLGVEMRVLDVTELVAEAVKP